jgi:carbonic anhydrase
VVALAAEASLSQNAAMFPERLTQGYRAFLDGRFAAERSRYEMLAETGQQPEIMVVGCVDSRVSPEVIFDASPGEMFVARNVANLVPPFETGGEYHGTSAALEFAVQALKVKHIVILGHARCGGVAAFAGAGAPLSPGDFIGRWVSLIAPAAERLGKPDAASEDYITRLELATIELSLANLMTFPCVKILVEKGRLHLHGAYFGVATGTLLIRDPETGAFAPAVEDLPGRASRMACR